MKFSFMPPSFPSTTLSWVCIYVYIYASLSPRKKSLNKMQEALTIPYTWILTVPPQIQVMCPHTTIHCCSWTLIPM